MQGRVFCFISFVILAGSAGCRREQSAAGEWGRLVLERTAPDRAQLGEIRVHARYCSRDSLLSIVGASDAWSAALALRTTWPGVRHFTVDTLPSGSGTGAVAARPIRDSIGVALISRSGSVDLDSGAVLAGHFTAAAGHDTTRITLSGRFEGMRPDTNGCPASGGG